MIDTWQYIVKLDYACQDQDHKCQSYPIQSSEFWRAQVILWARISVAEHLYTNWLTSSSSQVSIKIKQNLLIRQCLSSSLFFKVLLVLLSTISFGKLFQILTILLQNANFLKL